METKNNPIATATETKNIVDNLANDAAPTKTATAAPTKTDKAEKKAAVKVEKPAAKVAKPKVEKPAAKAATPKKAEKATAAPKKATADNKKAAAPKKVEKSADNKKAAAPKKAEKATATPKKAEKKAATPTNKKATAAPTNKKAATPKKVEVKEVNPAIEKARKELQKRELAYIIGKVVVAGLEQRLSREMKAEIENAKAQGKRVQPRYSTYHSAALSKETLETLRNMGIDYEQDCNGKGHRFRFFVPRKGTKAYKTLFGE